MIKIKVDEHRETEREEQFFDLQDVQEEIVGNSPEIDYENEDYPFERAWEFIQGLIGKVPNVWEHDVEWLEITVATNGDELLFRYEKDCEYVADLLDYYLFESPECHTGYYDPEDDERDNCVDANTGWYYIDWD